MADDKDKGLLGSAADRIRETTSSLRGEGPWHSANSNSNAPENVLEGTGGKPLCEECQRLNNSGGPVGNLTNL